MEYKPYQALKKTLYKETSYTHHKSIDYRLNAASEIKVRLINYLKTWCLFLIEMEKI